MEWSLVILLLLSMWYYFTMFWVLKAGNTALQADRPSAVSSKILTLVSFSAGYLKDRRLKGRHKTVVKDQNV